MVSRCVICDTTDKSPFEDDYMWIGWPKRLLVCWKCYIDVKRTVQMTDPGLTFTSCEKLKGHPVMELS